MSSAYDPTFEDFLRETFDIDAASDGTNANASLSLTGLLFEELLGDTHVDGTQCMDWTTPEMGPSFQGDIDSTAGFIAPTSLPEDLEDYLNPFEEDVEAAALGLVELGEEAPRVSSCDINTSNPIRCVATTTETIKPEEQDSEHLHKQLTAMLAQWSGAAKCGWPNCTSKATFKSRSALKTHVLNIHVNPLLCTVPNCTYKKPFGKEYELQRHIDTKHRDVRSHNCPVDNCDAKDNGFSRKDKLQKHLREKHGLLRCPYNHCSAVVLETETESHVEELHGPFECAIGACATGKKSCFREVDLTRHLRSRHSITYDPVLNIMSRLRYSHDGVARESLRSAWRDCQSCSTELGITNLVQDNVGSDM